MEKDVISFSLYGGLGNMMFQTATAEWVARVNGCDLCYKDAPHHFKFLKSFGKWVAHCREYLHIFPNVDWFKNQYRVDGIDTTVKIGFRHEPIHPKPGIHYDGYFQSSKNFDTDFARELFRPSVRVLEKLMPYRRLWQEGSACSVHVRRGNYVQLQDHHVVQPIEYYNKAMEIIDNDTDRYLVFSDDQDWCKENFKGDKFIFIKDTDYVEMFLMSKCSNNIIGNSSFSWWGAMLGDPMNRTVIAPSNWFPNNEPDASDIIPYYWTTI